MTDDPDTPDPDGPSEDKRAAPRRRILKQGVAAFHDQHSDLECVVRDMSDNGARLQFRDPSMVPDSFILHIPVDGTQVACERRWTRGFECGVEFVGKPEPSHLARLQHIDTAPPDGQSPASAGPAATAAGSRMQPAADEKRGFIELPPTANPFGHRKPQS